MEIHKAWAMPNSKTFKIKPIKELILKYAKSFGDKSIVVDPFANEGSIAQNLPPGTTYISNDLDTQYDTTYHLDALDFLRQFKDGSVDMVLFDPPYSPRQTSISIRMIRVQYQNDTVILILRSKYDKRTS